MRMLEPPRCAPEAVGGKAAALRSLEAAGFPVPPFLVSPDLPLAMLELGTPLAVRSSASIEDGAEHSFAGHFHSVLNLHSLGDVEAAVEACRASARSSAVVASCRRHGIDPASVRIVVIVQRMVQPELSGVAFTVDPLSGAERVIIEACEGLGDGLLGGTVAPLPVEHPLLRRHAAAIEAMARRVQLHFGAPQDIEFAIERGRLWVLQARPITSIAFPPDVGEWTNADFRDGGVSSTACTPLMWSLYDLVWQQALPGFLREIGLLRGDFDAGRMIFGRPYWNLGAVKRCLERLPGYVERELDDDLSVEARYDGDGVRTPVTALGVLRALPVMARIGRFFRRQRRFDERFLGIDGSGEHAAQPGAFDEIARVYEPLPDDVEASFERLVMRDFVLAETSYFRTIFAASLAKLAFKEAFPEADYAALIAGLPPMRHMAPLHALRAMAAHGERDVTPILERFGHHGSRGLDIGQPRWAEDRHFVEHLLATLPPDGGDDPRPRAEAARAAERARLPRRRRRRFDRSLERLRRFVWLREEMRDCSSRMYLLIRRHVLEIARRRGLGDDIFFMTIEEILRDDRAQIEPRRETYEGFRNFAAPNEIGARYRFDRPVWATTAATDRSLRGIAASRGIARGRAHVARSARDSLDAEPGAILVCPFTDPGWTVALDRVAAVVTETGGMLSHAAVICREHGIPAVLGVAGATRRIACGRMIVVDGNEGRVVLDGAGIGASA